MSELFSEPSTGRRAEPHIVGDVQKQLAGLRSRLTPRERERAITVITTTSKSVNAAIKHALALAVEGELVQIALKEGME